MRRIYIAIVFWTVALATSVSAGEVLWKETVTTHNQEISAHEEGVYPSQGPIRVTQASTLRSMEHYTGDQVDSDLFWEEVTTVYRPATPVQRAGTDLFVGYGEDEAAAMASALHRAVQYVFGVQESAERVLESSATTSGVAREFHQAVIMETDGYIHSWDVIAVSAATDSVDMRMVVSVTIGQVE